MSAVDYSYARPDPQALIDAGYTVVLRYLGRDSRCINRAELRRLHDAGLAVALIGQTTILRPLSGTPGGREDARKYNDLAAELDAPDWLPIFYVCDVGTEGGRSFPRTSDVPVIRDYCSGILDTPGRPVGEYGPYWVLEALRDLAVNNRRIECWWQTAGASGSGSGTGGSIRTGDGSVRRLSSLACMFQHYSYPDTASWGARSFGDQIDHNDILMEPVTWAWHPDKLPIEAPQILETMIMGKAVKLPDETDGSKDAIWENIDGLRRVPFAHPAEVDMAKHIGTIDNEIAELHGLWADFYKARYFPTDIHTVHWEKALLAQRAITKMDTMLTVLTTAISEIDDLELTPEQITELATKVTTAVGATIQASVVTAVDAELDQIAD